MYALWPQSFYVARVVFQKSWVLLANHATSATIATLSTKGGHIYRFGSCLSKKSTSPAVMFTSRLVLLSTIWLGLTRAPACVANMLRSLTQTHARALLWWCCITLVVLLLLLLPSLALATCHPRALSALVTRHTALQIVTKKRKHEGKKNENEEKIWKTSFCGYKKENVQSRLEKWNKQRKTGGGKKNVTKRKESKELPESSPTNNFLVGNYGLRRAERLKDMPSMSSEVGEYVYGVIWCVLYVLCS